MISSLSPAPSQAHYLQNLLDSSRPFLRDELESVDNNLPSLVAVLRSAGARGVARNFYMGGRFKGIHIFVYAILDHNLSLQIEFLNIWRGVHQALKYQHLFLQPQGPWPPPSHYVAPPLVVQTDSHRDEDIELVVPPVFENCKRVLDAREHIVARDLSWEAVCDMSKNAEELLLSSIEKNPFVGEPHVVLGQVYLTKGMFEEAEREAERGLTLMLEWGSSRDKRCLGKGGLLGLEFC